MGNRDVTIVSAVMGRNDIALEAFQNWVSSGIASEIIVVDWSSTLPVSKVYEEKSVKIISVVGEKYWDLCKAFNFAFTFAKNKKIIKLDIDYRITSDLAKHIFKEEKKFYVTSVDLREKSRGIDGFLACTKKQFDSVNGYDERLCGWGHDDSDINERLLREGYFCEMLPSSFVDLLWHKPHPSCLRTENSECKNSRMTGHMNSKISCIHGFWGIKNVRSSYLEISPNTFRRII